MATPTIKRNMELARPSVSRVKPVPAGGDEDQTAAFPSVNQPGAEPSIASLFLSLAINIGVGAYLLGVAFHDWLAGPPMTTQQRERLSIRAADRHWKLWMYL